MEDCILITGASRGIGKAIAMEFASKGKNIVVLCKNNYDKLLELKKEISKYNISCYAYQIDVSSYKEVIKLAQQLDEQRITISSIINNAGICFFGLLQDMEISQWNNIINTNLSSVFYICKTFIDNMIYEHKGCIINISSVWGNVGASCEVAYSASKGGVNSFTKALAKELAPSGISVNAIACGAINTDMNSNLSKSDIEELDNEIPFGRFGLPEEVAALVYNIYSSPSYLTGQIITLDGGWI